MVKNLVNLLKRIVDDLANLSINSIIFGQV